MAISDNLVYWIRPQSGDSAPHNEAGEGALTIAGTTLVDVASEYAWRIANAAETGSLPSFSTNMSADGGGASFAIDIEVQTYDGSSYASLFAAHPSADINQGLQLTQNTTNNVRPRYNAALNLSHAAGTARRRYVYVAKALSGSLDTGRLWIGATGRVGVDPDSVSAGSNQTSRTINTLTLGSAGSTIRLYGLAVWSRELTDAEAAAVADNGIHTELGGGGDTTAPTLTSPTGTATGATTASGAVSTDEANGTLYYLASTNASESATTVKAASSQAVSETGSQSVSFTGLTASTTYYAHYVHRDAAGNDSAVASSASFTTSAAGDTTPPTLTGSITISALTTTSYTATWPAGSDDTAVTGYEYRIASGSWVDAGNVLTVDISGRTPGATETFEVRAYDAAANVSTPALSTSVTLLLPTVTVTEPLKNNTGTLLASQSGITAAVLQAADLVSVYETSGLTTNPSGILATISDAAIVTGQQYHVAIKLADGGVGITGPITAS